jgi:hypothetical protein
MAAEYGIRHPKARKKPAGAFTNPAVDAMLSGPFIHRPTGLETPKKRQKSELSDRYALYFYRACLFLVFCGAYIRRKGEGIKSRHRFGKK